MRVLLMISNSNMSARELYGIVLRERFPGWGVSNMSGLPANPGAIVKSFDVLVYEIGAPDDPKRHKLLITLLGELEGLPHVRIVTRIEGPYREGIVADLECRGVICVGVPFGLQTVAEAFARTAPSRSAPGQDTQAASGFGGRLRRLFRRKE